MSIMTAISQGGSSDAERVDHAHASSRKRSRSLGPVPENGKDEPISCVAYERLMAGEWVSWSQILREHPMLGQITVTELINAGVVRVEPVFDPVTGQIDVRLCTRPPDHIAQEPAYGTRAHATIETATWGEGRKPQNAPRGERRLKVRDPR